VWAAREPRGVRRWLGSFGSEPMQLTSGQLNSLAPVFSPDGKKLFIVGQQLHGELVRYDQSHHWLPYLSGISAECVDFSRDRRWVTYVSFPEGALWRSRIDGSERRRLTRPPMQIFHPYWSPDGGQIAFMGISPGSPTRIYAVSSDGGTPEPLLKEPHNQQHPSWSPDGKSLIFGYLNWLETAPRGIVLLNLRTHRTVALPGSEGLWEGEWSPDGEYIVARTLDSHALMLFDVRSQRWAELVRSDIGWLKWSTDGRYVYFYRIGPEASLMRVRVHDHSVEQVVPLKDMKNTG
ncbi:MAG: hypothetical protein M3Y57_10455, partial [Acidobacteriota bacterium]|nr:hypothetical protein [Acidobacteriota bacterium]